MSLLSLSLSTYIAAGDETMDRSQMKIIVIINIIGPTNVRGIAQRGNERGWDGKTNIVLTRLLFCIVRLRQKPGAIQGWNNGTEEVL